MIFAIEWTPEAIGPWLAFVLPILWGIAQRLRWKRTADALEVVTRAVEDKTPPRGEVRTAIASDAHAKGAVVEALIHAAAQRATAAVNGRRGS